MCYVICKNLLIISLFCRSLIIYPSVGFFFLFFFRIWSLSQFSPVLQMWNDDSWLCQGLISISLVSLIPSNHKTSSFWRFGSSRLQVLLTSQCIGRSMHCGQISSISSFNLENTFSFSCLFFISFSFFFSWVKAWNLDVMDSFKCINFFWNDWFQTTLTI